VDKYHLITGGPRAPSFLQLFSCGTFEMCSSQEMGSHNHSHLQPAGEEQDYSSLYNRGDRLVDLNAKDFMLALHKTLSLRLNLLLLYVRCCHDQNRKLISIENFICDCNFKRLQKWLESTHSASLHWRWRVNCGSKVLRETTSAAHESLSFKQIFVGALPG
jgi:hypothetical protein